MWPGYGVKGSPKLAEPDVPSHHYGLCLCCSLKEGQELMGSNLTMCQAPMPLSPLRNTFAQHAFCSEASEKMNKWGDWSCELLLTGSLPTPPPVSDLINPLRPSRFPASLQAPAPRAPWKGNSTGGLDAAPSISCCPQQIHVKAGDEFPIDQICCGKAVF